MNKILMIANYFPPDGGAGVQRTSKFVKYLPMFGYEPIVLTRDSKGLTLTDKTLLEDVRGVQAIRTRAYDYGSMSGILKIPGKVFSRYILIPDGERIWAERSLSAAEEAIREHNIKLIYSTSSPYSAHLLALKLKKRNPGLKWVCDFRDEWTNNPYLLDAGQNPIRRRIEKVMEREVLYKADARIANTPVMTSNFIRLNNLPEGSFHTIPNGYDQEDFIGIDTAGKRPKTDRFTITYTGALYGRRRPDTFFEALKGLIEGGGVCEEEFVVRLIGYYNESRLRAAIENCKLSGVVEILPYMPHGESIRALSQSDCLLLIEGSGTGAEAFYTGKVFEYMRVGVPVLAIIPKNGVAAELVNRTNIGIVCDFDNIDEIGRGIMLYYNLWKTGGSNYAPLYNEIAKYERRELTKQLAVVFDGLLGQD